MSGQRKDVVDVAAEAAVLAILRPQLSATQIAHLMKRRRRTVLAAVRAARAFEMADDLSSPRPSSGNRFPLVHTDGSRDVGDASGDRGVEPDPGRDPKGQRR